MDKRGFSFHLLAKTTPSLTSLGHDFEVLQGVVSSVSVGALWRSTEAVTNGHGHRRQLDDALMLAGDGHFGQINVCYLIDLNRKGVGVKKKQMRTEA